MGIHALGAHTDASKATPERTHRYIYKDKGFEEKDADNIVKANINEGTKAVAAEQKKRPDSSKYTDPDDFQDAMDSWRAKADQARADLEYWEQVKAIHDAEEAERLNDGDQNRDAAYDVPRYARLGAERYEGDPIGAFERLMKIKEGDVSNVFHRDGMGYVDLIWGEENGGLCHILNKHVGEGKSFSDWKDAANAIADIIENGGISLESGDKIVFRSGKKLVTVRKNIREGGKKNSRQELGPDGL